MKPFELARKKTGSIDWLSFLSAVTLCVLGLFTMDSFSSGDPLFIRQIIWIGLSVAVFFGASVIDWRFLRRGGVAAAMYATVLVPLVILVVLGHATKGAKSWFALGPFALQPVEFVKLALIV